MNALFNNPKLMSQVRGMIEVGASIGEEIAEWEKFKISRQIFIEPISELCDILENRAKQQPHSPDLKVFRCALGNEDGVGDFHMSTGSTCSSSLLEFSKEAIRYGQTMKTSEIRKIPVWKLDTLVKNEKIDLSQYNLLFIDVQGNEHNLIRGAENSLPFFDFIFCEVNFFPLYEGVTLWDDFRAEMTQRGFRLIDIRPLEGSNSTQGEALFFSSEYCRNLAKAGLVS